MMSLVTVWFIIEMKIERQLFLLLNNNTAEFYYFLYIDLNCFRKRIRRVKVQFI